jgi:hypothetical protein
MTKYKAITGSKGTRYLKDGKLIAKSKIPEATLKALDEGDDKGKFCIFCGIPCKYERFINLQTVYVCEEHYQNKTVGQTAQRMNNEKEETKA